jgi:hypothetical protein
MVEASNQEWEVHLETFQVQNAVAGGVSIGGGESTLEEIAFQYAIRATIVCTEGNNGNTANPDVFEKNVF